MRRNLIYIIPLISTLLSCSDEVVEKGTEYLNGSEKTPLAISVTAPITKSSTRAFDGEFEKDDVLKAYVRHVTATENTSEGITTYSGIALVSGDGVGPAWANMTVGTIVENSKDSDGKVKADNYTGSSVTPLTLSPVLYWDDFSNSSSADTDLRTRSHYLQSYYGYCYNGGSPTTALNNETGVLGWTVATDQTSEFKTSDLLWSKTQDPVAYAHGDNNTITGRNSVLTIPYTHAMSKVTIVVKCEDGFNKSAADIFNSNTAPSSVVLQGMNTVATVTAPTQTISGETADNITMKKGSIVDSETEKKCTFEAIIVPTAMTNNKHLATINDVDGNKYDVNLSTAILETDPTGSSKSWNSELTSDNVTKPGVNYMLTVTIKKQEIKVEAKIADWEQVNAESEAEIKFTTDISGYKYDETLYPEEKRKEFVSGDKIDLYKNTETSFTDRSSIATYTAAVKDDGENITTPAYWTCDPVLYWAGKGDQEYFRAIYPSAGTKTDAGKITGNKFTITAGEGSEFDILWGTTAKHSGKKIDGTDYTYEEGAAIDPRTKEVPLIFYHKTSKVKVVLRTPATEAEGKVTITSAKIQFTNLVTSADVDMDKGGLTLGSSFSAKVFADGTVQGTTDKRPTVTTSTEGVTATDDLFMIPQTIPADNTGTTEEDEAAYIIITLSDNTTYKLKLRDCKCVIVDADGNLSIQKDENGQDKYVTKWEPGESYTYYINVTKEKIQFFALIKDWKEVNVSGDATMEWDDTIAEDLEAGTPGAGDPNGTHNEGRTEGKW